MARALLLGAVVALAAGPAFAFIDVRSEYGANVIISNTKSVGSGATASAGRVVTGMGEIAGPGGSKVAARISTVMAERVIVGGVSRLFPAAMVIGVAYELWRDMRMRQKPDGGTEWDSGEPERMGADFSCSGETANSGFGFSGPGLACSSILGKMKYEVAAGCNVLVHTFAMGGPASTQSGDGAYDLQETVTARPLYPWCDPYPAYTVTKSGGLVWTQRQGMRCEFGAKSPADGLCPREEGGKYDVELAPEQVADKYEAAKNKPGVTQPTQADWDALTEALVGRATDANPWSTPDQPHKLVEPYPATVPGGVSTTVHPDGTVTEVATGWNIRPAFEFPTNPGKSTSGKTTTTTTKDAQGNVTGTSTTTEVPSVETPSEQQDPCTANPDRIGCAKFGEVEDVSLEKRDVDVSLTPMSGWGSGGECPAPPTVTIFGHSAVLDNTLVCTFLGALKFVLVAVAGIVAARIFIGGVQEG